MLKRLVPKSPHGKFVGVLLLIMFLLGCNVLLVLRIFFRPSDSPLAGKPEEAIDLAVLRTWADEQFRKKDLTNSQKLTPPIAELRKEGLFYSGFYFDLHSFDGEPCITSTRTLGLEANWLIILPTNSVIDPSEPQHNDYPGQRTTLITNRIYWRKSTI